MGKKKCKGILAYAAMALVIATFAVAALYPTGYVRAEGYATNVGGLPIVISTHGHADGTLTAADDVTWDTPDNFTPDYVRCIDDVDSQPSINEWYLGMADGTALHSNGSVVAAWHANGTANCNITAAAGSITITNKCLSANQGWTCIAVRYSK